MAKVTKPDEVEKNSPSPIAPATESIEKNHSIKESKAGKHEKAYIPQVGVTK